MPGPPAITRQVAEQRDRGSGALLGELLGPEQRSDLLAELGEVADVGAHAVLG